MRNSWFLFSSSGLMLLASMLPAQSSEDFLAGKVSLEGRELPYRLLAPAKVEEGKRYPLILFLHGRGESGEDNERQLAYLPRWMATPERRAAQPCFLLAPQCPRDSAWNAVDWEKRRARGLGAPTWSQRAVIAALQEVVRSQPVDVSRIHLTGLSMGGFGAWELAARHPEWFASVVPVCGGGHPDFVRRLSGLPIWAWHGAADGVIPPVASEDMISALRARGHEARFSLLEGVAHDSWSAAYGEDGALSWMFAQRRDDQRPLPGLESLRRTSAIRRGERIAFLGDSITESGVRKGGYVQLIQAALESRGDADSLKVIGAGISGHKVPNLEERLERDVIAKGATLVFIYIGINDVWHSKSGRGTSAADYEAGLHRIVRRLEASGATVVLATPTVIGERAPGTNELDAMLERYAALSRAVAAEHGLVLADLRRDMTTTLSVLNPGDAERGVLTGDGVHLNAAGNRFLADHAARALVAAMEARPPRLPVARITGEGWTRLTLDDFVNVNGTADTWSRDGDDIVCTGKPLGGARSKKTYTNFELVLEWKHHRHAGNSGVFLWCPEGAFTDLPPGKLPRSGIEVQVLDLGYEENWLRNKKARSNWFTSHGDVFPVGASKMAALTPEITYRAEDGSTWKVGRPGSRRSFPTRRLTRPAGQWNHYYVRALNGEVRLWVNGHEVNGGTACSPASGYLALESEGSLVTFRNLRIRELP